MGLKGGFLRMKIKPPCGGFFTKKAKVTLITGLGFSQKELAEIDQREAQT